MKTEYLNTYNNLIKLSRNKNLYSEFTDKDTFSHRLTILLIHFAFFIKNYKNKSTKKTIQTILNY